MKRIFFFTITIISFLISPGATQSDLVYIIFGNPDGSPIYARIDSDIKIGVHVSFYEDVGFLHIPLSSDDSIIVSRDGGEFFYPLNEWDEVDFLPPNPDSSMPGYTNQSILGFYDLGGDPNPPLNPLGDTIMIANYFMHTTDDTGYLYELVCPFYHGWHPANGIITFGIGGTILPLPITTFSCLFLLDYYPGDANNSGEINGLDILYLVNYFKETGAPPDPMLAGDANGDCMVNGLDVIYLVSYFKGGPEPFYGDCY